MGDNKICCERCGSFDVEYAAWYAPNTGDVNDAFGTWNNGDNTYCSECDDNVDLVDESAEPEKFRRAQDRRRTFEDERKLCERLAATRKAVRSAYERFWEALAAEFPEIKSGDLSVEADTKFQVACREAAETWLEQNQPAPPPPEPASATSTISVILFTPIKAGDRIWWVLARTPEAALDEVLRESEDLGFKATAPHDGVTPDEHGMIPARIVIRR